MRVCGFTRNVLGLNSAWRLDFPWEVLRSMERLSGYDAQKGSSSPNSLKYFDSCAIHLLVHHLWTFTSLLGHGAALEARA
jgi:hypothetical protein